MFTPGLGQKAEGAPEQDLLLFHKDLQFEQLEWCSGLSLCVTHMHNTCTHTATAVLCYNMHF